MRAIFADRARWDSYTPCAFADLLAPNQHGVRAMGCGFPADDQGPHLLIARNRGGRALRRMARNIRGLRPRCEAARAPRLQPVTPWEMATPLLPTLTFRNHR